MRLSRVSVLFVMLTAFLTGCGDKTKFTTPTNPVTKIPEKGDFIEPGIGARPTSPAK